MATIEYGAATDVGKVRTNNEDSFGADKDAGLFLVADGMGGHASGEIASRMAADIITRTFRRSIEQPAGTDATMVMEKQGDTAVSEPAGRLVAAIRLANQAIFEASQAYPQNKGMGTTVVAALVRDDSYVLAWVGDSRIYLVRHGHLQQLTNDHSLVQEQLSRGLISDKEAEASEFKNILTRALGTAENVEVDVVEVPAFEDDYLLLCSDGLTRMVSDADILATVKKAEQPQEICRELVALANENGGKDNVTAIVVNRKPENIWTKFLKTLGKAD